MKVIVAIFALFIFVSCQPENSNNRERGSPERPKQDNSTYIEESVEERLQRIDDSIGDGSSVPVEVSNKVSKKIKSILYSDKSDLDRLKLLEPYIAIGDDIGKFHTKYGLIWFSFGSGPGIFYNYYYEDCGLSLTVESETNKVVSIGRSSEEINEVFFEHETLSNEIFKRDGYIRINQ